MTVSPSPREGGRGGGRRRKEERETGLRYVCCVLLLLLLHSATQSPESFWLCSVTVRQDPVYIIYTSPTPAAL